MRRLVTYQDALRQILETRVARLKRKQVAEMLGLKSVQALDYLRAGQSIEKKGGKVKPRYITFEHLARLAEAENKTYSAMLQEVAFALDLLQGERETNPREPIDVRVSRRKSLVPVP